jgi:hypothetical protein
METPHAAAGLCADFSFFSVTPAISADLDGPVYRERDVVIERPAPPRVVECERIIEHHYHYAPAPAYTERRYYAEPHVYYAPRAYDYDDGPRYTQAGWWRPRYFFPRGPYYRHHHRGW